MRILALFLAILVMALPAATYAQPSPAPRAVVDEFHGALLAAMKSGDSSGFAGRQKLLDPAVRKSFDLPLMTRIVVGPAWQSMPPKDQAAVTAAFANWAVASYAGRFSAFNGEQFVIGDIGDGGRGTIQVKSQIKPRGDAPTTLIYRIKSGKIVDVYLDGSISQLASWRSEFASVLQKQGTAGLIARMKQLTVELARKN